MIREYDLGDMSMASDEEIAEAIVSSIIEEGKSPGDYIYRGITCDKEKLARIRQNGTDRTEEGREQAARILFETNYRHRGMSWEEALDATDPRVILAAPLEKITSAVESADMESAENSVVLVYHAAKVRKVDRFFVGCEYEFNCISPLEALDSIYRFSIE